MNNLRVYKLGDIYKYISLPVISSVSSIDSDLSKICKRSYDKKLNCNLIRAKSHVKDLILCNNFIYFITITVNPKYDRYDLDYIRKIVNQRIRNFKFKEKIGDFSFIFIPEQHKNGAWHLHGLLGHSFNITFYTNCYGFESCSLFDSLGFNNVSIINDDDKVSSYITKYITKSFESREKGSHCYFASQGLMRPKLVESFIYDNSLFDFHFFDIKNDYCYLRYSDKYYNNITNLLQK